MKSEDRNVTPRLTESGVITDHSGRSSRYMTDGVNLYRYVGTIPSSMGHMIGLENCHSLDLTLWPIAELRPLRLRNVTPAVPPPAEAGRC
jgi:hypothetical protein